MIDFREYTGKDVFGTEHPAPRYRIFVADRFVGYMHKRPGSTPMLTEPISDSERKLIEVAASQLDGVERTRTVQAPYIPPGEHPADEEDDE